ncbi:MAG TPA: kelch repeat-containing protein, partial [Fibrella sp.]
MPAALMAFGACLAPNGNIYLVGGKQDYTNNSGPFLDETYIFNPTTNTFTTGPNLPLLRGEHALVSTSNGIYCMGGVTGSLSSANNVLGGNTTGSISGSPFCGGESVSVPFTEMGGFYTGNVFTAQLSNAAGSFLSPINIGTLSGTNSGTINATIPVGTPAGTGYRIRVVSSSAVFTGSNNGTNLTVLATVTPSVNITANPSTTVALPTTSITFTATPVNGGASPSYQWKKNGLNVGTNSATYTASGWTDGDVISVVLTSNAACPFPAIATDAVTITVLTAITTNAVSGSPFCPGETISVPFTKSGTFNAGNVFTAQLSNAAGSFASPTNIGTLTSVNSGTISATIPAGAAQGSGYRIRVVGSNPSTTGTDNGMSLSVNPPGPAQPSVITGDITVCSGVSQTYSVTAVSNATSYTWTLPLGWTGTSTTNTITVTPSASSGSITVTAANSCGTSASSNLAVTTSATPAQPGTINGSATVCPNVSQTYSVPAVAGATTYTWTLPAGWSGTSTANSITVTTGTSGGTISVTANNSCGASVVRTLVVAATAAPAAPGTISGATSLCSGMPQTYTVPAVAGATSYTWALPPGWTGTSTTNSISATPNATGGTVSVTATNACGLTSAASTLSVSSGAAPTQPSPINGSTAVCSGVSQTYSTAPVSGATSYNWTLPAGWVGTSNTNSIFVTPMAAGGTISVTAMNTCGTSTPRTLAVTSAAAPGSAASINGPVSVCPGIAQIYSVTPVSSATTYTWTLPSGWGGTSTTASISATPNSSSGNITVTANNSCGSSLVTTLAVNAITTSTAPGAISGPSVVCAGVSQSYTVTAVPGTTSYTWTLPAGWSGTSTTNTITATTAAGTGTVSVTSTNACGQVSTASTLAVTAGSAPPQPGPIGGGATACSGVPQTFSITPVGGATSYTWTLPPGWTGGSTGASITATPSASGGTISVVANTSCGTSTPSTLAVTIGASPAQPGGITGSTTVCSGASQPYSITPVSGATSYTWTLPAGWSGTSTTTSITAMPGATGGNITVSASNACGTSLTSSLAVTTTNTPNQPGFITGSSTVCSGIVQVYSVVPVAGATSYNWT